MVIAALVCFAILLVAWVLAPERAEASVEPTVLSLPESEPIAA